MIFIVIPKTKIKNDFRKFCKKSLEDIIANVNKQWAIEKYDYFFNRYVIDYTNYVDSIFINKETYNSYINDMNIHNQINNAHVYIRSDVNFGEIVLLSNGIQHKVKILQEDRMSFQNFILYIKNA